MIAQNFSDANQSATTSQMPVSVVDSFQPVHIEQHDAERVVSAARTIEFRFDHADEPAIVGEPGERIGYGHGTHLIKQGRLMQQSASQHHHVAGGLAEFSKEEQSIEKLAGQRSRN